MVVPKKGFRCVRYFLPLEVVDLFFSELARLSYSHRSELNVVEIASNYYQVNRCVVVFVLYHILKLIYSYNLIIIYNNIHFHFAFLSNEVLSSFAISYSSYIWN